MAAASMMLTACNDWDEGTNVSDAKTVVVNFEQAKLPKDGVLKGVSYTEKGYKFENYYTNDGYEYNSGYTVSNNTDMVTEGFMNQYSVYASGGGAGSSKFAIYNPSYYGKCYISRADGASFRPEEMAIALTTYTYLSTSKGDGYAKKFEASDWYKMTITGYDAHDKEIYTKEFSLIENLNFWTPWKTIPLTELGTVNKLYIDFTSSDTGEWGMNTPAYIAIDNLKVSSIH